MVRGSLRRSFALRMAATSAALVLLVCSLGFGWGYWRVEGPWARNSTLP